MKRFILAVAVLGLMACAKKEEAVPVVEETAPPAAPAPVDTAMAAPADTMRP